VKARYNIYNVSVGTVTVTLFHYEQNAYQFCRLWTRPPLHFGKGVELGEQKWSHSIGFILAPHGDKALSPTVFVESRIVKDRVDGQKTKMTLMLRANALASVAIKPNKKVGSWPTPRPMRRRVVLQHVFPQFIEEVVGPISGLVDIHRENPPH
jgi:hypothetical protein